MISTMPPNPTAAHAISTKGMERGPAQAHLASTFSKVSSPSQQPLTHSGSPARGWRASARQGVAICCIEESLGRSAGPAQRQGRHPNAGSRQISLLVVLLISERTLLIGIRVEDGVAGLGDLLGLAWGVRVLIVGRSGQPLR
jgi:hypothetical protein